MCNGDQTSADRDVGAGERDCREFGLCARKYAPRGSVPVHWFLFGATARFTALNLR